MAVPKTMKGRYGSVHIIWGIQRLYTCRYFFPALFTFTQRSTSGYAMKLVGWGYLCGLRMPCLLFTQPYLVYVVFYTAIPTSTLAAPGEFLGFLETGQILFTTNFIPSSIALCVCIHY